MGRYQRHAFSTLAHTTQHQCTRDFVLCPAQDLYKFHGCTGQAETTAQSRNFRWGVLEDQQTTYFPGSVQPRTKGTILASPVPLLQRPRISPQTKVLARVEAIMDKHKSRSHILRRFHHVNCMSRLSLSRSYGSISVNPGLPSHRCDSSLHQRACSYKVFC